MKISAALLGLLFFTSSAFASRLQRLGNDGSTVADLLASVQASRRAPGFGSSVVTGDVTKNSFIIPVAGSVQGANGTFFKSDVTIANRRATPQIISVGFLKRGVNNGSAPVQNFTLPANFTDVERDFIGTTLGESGLGTILVVAKTSTATNSPVDTNASIDGFSRIWTPQPGSAGSVSQSFEAISIEETALNRWAYGVRHDESFRTNVGIVNLSSVDITFNVQVIGLRGSTSFPQLVHAFSMEQVGVPAGIYGDGFVFFTGATDIIWSAYGTSVDNVTGDGWVTHAH
jgi:hypothetical protein